MLSCEKVNNIGLEPLCHKTPILDPVQSYIEGQAEPPIMRTLLKFFLQPGSRSDIFNNVLCIQI